MSEIIPILPHLWIADYTALEDLSWLRKKKIHIIFHISKEHPFFAKSDIEELRIPVDYDDNSSLEVMNKNIYECLFDFCQFIHEKMNAQKNILVLGLEGRQDPDVFAAAYFIMYGKVFPSNAINYVKSKKKNAFFERNTFLPALNKFCNELNKNFST